MSFTATDSFNEQRTTTNSSGEREVEVGIFQQSSTTESISTENVKTGKEVATEIPVEPIYAPQELSTSSGNNELQQQHSSSISSTFFLASTVSASTQHQALDSSYLMATKQPKLEEYEPSYFTTSNAIIIHNPSSSKQQFQAQNTIPITTPTTMQKTSISQETVPLPDITSKQLLSNFVNNNISSFAIDALSNETTKEQTTSNFSETQEISGSYYGSNLIFETSTHINEYFPNSSTNTVPSSIVKLDISTNLRAANTKSQGSAVQHSGDYHERNILGNTKNSADMLDRNNSQQIEKNLFRTTNISSFAKNPVKPRIQLLLPSHFSSRNGNTISNNVSSIRQISLKQETISRSFKYFGSDAVKSNRSNGNTLVVTTHEETFTPTATSDGISTLGSQHSLSVDDIPDVTDEKATLDNFGQQTDDLEDGSNSEQQSSLSDGYYLEEHHSFTNLDTKSSTGNIAGIDEKNSQTNGTFYLTKVFPYYENEEIVKHGESPVRLGYTDISEQEQVVYSHFLFYFMKFF